MTISIEELEQGYQQRLKEPKTPIPAISMEELEKNYRAKPEPRNIVSEVGAALASGVYGGNENYLRAARALNIPGLDDQIATLEKMAEPYKPTREGFGSKSLYGGISSTVESILNSVPGTVLGGLKGAKLGPAGAVAGATIGYATSAATIFSLAEYDKFMEEAEKIGLARDVVRDEAVISAISEGAFEIIPDLIGAKIFGLIGKKPLTKPVQQGLLQAFKRFTGKTLELAAVEIPGEMATSATEAKMRQDVGIPTEAPWEAALSAVGPTSVQTGIMGMMGHGGAHLRRMGQPTNQPGEQEVRTDLAELEKRYQEKQTEQKVKTEPGPEQPAVGTPPVTPPPETPSGPAPGTPPVTPPPGPQAAPPIEQPPVTPPPIAQPGPPPAPVTEVPPVTPPPGPSLQGMAEPEKTPVLTARELQILRSRLNRAKEIGAGVAGIEAAIREYEENPFKWDYGYDQTLDALNIAIANKEKELKAAPQSPTLAQMAEGPKTPPETAKTPQPETITPPPIVTPGQKLPEETGLKKLENDLVRKGAGELGNVFYSIQERDDGKGYYFRKTENGKREDIGDNFVNPLSMDEARKAALLHAETYDRIEIRPREKVWDLVDKKTGKILKKGLVSREAARAEVWNVFSDVAKSVREEKAETPKPEVKKPIFEKGQSVYFADEQGGVKSGTIDRDVFEEAGTIQVKTSAGNIIKSIEELYPSASKVPKAEKPKPETPSKPYSATEENPPTSEKDAVDSLRFWLNEIEASHVRILSGKFTDHDARVIHQGPVIAQRISNWIELKDDQRWKNEQEAVSKVKSETLSGSLMGMPKGWQTGAKNEANHYASHIKEMRERLDNYDNGKGFLTNEEIKPEAPKPETKREDPRWAAIGAVSGSHVRRAEEQGWVFGWADEIGELTDDERHELAGPLTGARVKQLIERGLSAKRKKPEETTKAEKIPTISYEIKKEFEKENRKRFESLSYIGKLVSREELPNNWVKLTYEKVGEKTEEPLEALRRSLETTGNGTITDKQGNKINYRIGEYEGTGEYAYWKKTTPNAGEIRSRTEPTKKQAIDKAIEDARVYHIKTLPVSEEVEELPSVEKEAYPRAIKSVAEKVKDYLQKSKGLITSQQLFRWADEAFGGTQAEGKYSPKDAYDAMELGINLVIQDADDTLDPSMAEEDYTINQIQGLKKLLSRIPTQTRRTEEMDEFQQFSTPPPFAYVVNWAANISKDDSVLEPSGGTGNLAVMAQNAGAGKVYVNELSPRRAAILKLLGFDRVFTEQGEQINNILPKEIKPTVIVMNPPFSATGGRITGRRQTMEGAKHVEQALKRLEPGGRLVAIVGRGMSEDAATFKDWWRDIKKDYWVRANIRVNGKEYVKFGTHFDNQIIIIDKIKKDSYTTLKGEVEKVEDLIPLLREIRNERNYPGKQEAGKPEGEKGPGAGQTETGLKPSVLPATGTVGSEVGETGGEVSEPPGKPGEPALPVGAQGGHEAGGIERPGRPGGPVLPGRGPKRPATTGSKPPGEPSQQPEREPARIPDSERPSSELQIETIEKEARGELTEDLYEGYKPEKIKIPGSKRHPTPLVQSAAMAAVVPPDPTYKPNLPQESIKAGKISDIQLEQVVYAGQAHEDTLPDGQRRGYFIGDGTGVGKGREIAAILWDNWNKGRTKALWLSEKKALHADAQRDIAGVGWDSDLVINHAKIKAGATIEAKKGILFTTYDTLKMGQKEQGGKTRLDQIADWLGPDFDGVIAFDESHNMGNAIATRGERGIKQPSQKALAGVELQRRLPKARVVYVSATGATEVNNLGYAERLGLWGEGTPFADKVSFIHEIESGGIAAMELVARDMKQMGIYNARSLSYDGVNYDRLEHPLSEAQKDIYNKLAEAWQIVLQNISDALGLTDGDKNGRAKSAVMGQFWGAHQRFFNQIITSMQTPAVINKIHEDIEAGHAVVIQLTSTLEASQERALAKLSEEDSLDDLDLTPRDSIMQLVENSFPTQQFEPVMDPDGNIKYEPVTDAAGNKVENPEAVAMRDRLLDELGSIKVPDSSMNMILKEFGTDKVAEITGRRRRVVRQHTERGEETVIEKRSRAKCDADADAFMNDKKRILIFSDAGGTGRSYHADMDAKNQRKRIHYLLQAGWRADRAVQGMGRTHRSNQKQPPQYWLVTTDIKGQKRFISSIARRLDQLGALTKGQRQTGSQGIFNARDNLESDYARDALRIFFENLVHQEIESISPAEFQDQTGLQIMDEFGNLIQDLPPIRQFLNRLLSLNIDTMNNVFDEFSKRIDDVIEGHIRAGTLDQGLETLKAQSIRKAREETVHRDERSGAETKYVQLDVSHPAPFLEWSEARNWAQEFYRNRKSGKVWGGVRRSETNRRTGEIEDLWVLKSPSFGQQRIVLEEFTEEKWEKLLHTQAEELWHQTIEQAPKTIEEQKHLITGAILPIWDRLTGHPGIMRVQTDEGDRMIGRLIDPALLNTTLQRLGAESQAIKMDPQEIHARILEQNYTIELANGWRMMRRRVSGEDRIEIKGPDYREFDILKKYGVFSERIQYDTRYFIPVDARGVEAIKQITKNSPITAANPPVAATMGAREGESALDAITRDSGFIALDLLISPAMQRRIQAFADEARNSRIAHYLNWLRGRQDARIQIYTQEKHGPQLGAFIRNMEGILSQTNRGRDIYEAGRKFKEDTVAKFREWEQRYTKAVEGFDDQEKRALLNILDSEEEITGNHPVEIAAAEIRGLLQDVRKYLMDQGYKVGYIEGYLPHIFQGRFWVRAKDEYSHKVETLGEALKIAGEWADAGKEEIRVMQDTFIPPDDATMLSNRAYWRLVKKIQHEIGEAVETFEELDAKDIHKMLSEGKVARPKPRKRFFGNRMRRLVNNPNFIKDLDRIMHLYFYGASRKVSQDVFMRKVQKNLEAMPVGDTRLKQFIETVYLPGTLAHPTNMEEAIANVLHKLKVAPGWSGQDVRKVMHKFNLVQYVMDLGLSVSSAVANASQFWMNAYPIVGERSAVKGYSLGARTFRERQLLAEVEEEGITQSVSSITGEIIINKEKFKEFAAKLVAGKGGVQGFMEATLMPFSTVEMMNRFSTYWAGKDYARKALMKGKSAEEIAREVVPETGSLVRMGREYDARLADTRVRHNAAWTRKTAKMQERFARRFGYELNEKVNFRAGRENLPTFLREVPVRLISPYKTFLTNQIKYTISALSPKGIVTNPKKALRFVGMTLAFAGVAGNPVIWGLFQMVRWLYKQFFGVDLEKELRRRNLLRGITGKLGFDISGSVAVQLPTRAYDLLGRFGKIAYEVATLAKAKMEGAGSIETERKLQRLSMPAQMQRVADAINILEKGVYETPISRTPISLGEVPWGAAVKRALGMMPVEVSKTFEEEEEIQKKKAKYQSLSHDLTERWATAVKENNVGQMDRVIRRVVREVNETLDQVQKAKSKDEIMEAMTDLMFWKAWIDQDQKFKDAIKRKGIPRQIERKMRLPKYLQPEAMAQ